MFEGLPAEPPCLPAEEDDIGRKMLARNSTKEFELKLKHFNARRRYLWCPAKVRSVRDVVDWDIEGDERAGGNGEGAERSEQTLGAIILNETGRERERERVNGTQGARG